MMVMSSIWQQRGKEPTMLNRLLCPGVDQKRKINRRQPFISRDRPAKQRHAVRCVQYIEDGTIMKDEQKDIRRGVLYHSRTGEHRGVDFLRLHSLQVKKSIGNQRDRCH
jgi:hypothetical protein